MMELKMIGSTNKILILLFLILMIPTGNLQNEYEPSPCPKVFIYLYDPSVGLYGMLQVAQRDSNAIYLDVELSIGNIFHGYNGHIELAKSKGEIIQDILNHRPVLFKVFFPAWINIPPKVTKILVNGNLICVGPPVPFNLVPFISTTRLYYKLRFEDLSRPLPQPSRTNTIFSTGSQPPRLSFNGAKYSPNSYSENGFTFQEHPAAEPPLRNTVVLDFNVSPISVKTSTHRNRPTETFKQSDESSFMLNGEVNRHNCRYWSDVNPHLVMETHSQTPQKLNVWAGILSNYIVGLFFIEDNIPFKPTSTQSPTNTLNPVIQQNVYEDSKPQVFRVITENTTDTLYQSVCGRPITTNTLMISGNEVPRGAFPWLAAIFGVKPAGTYFLCGASLVSDRHVITAAHCTMKENKILRTNELLIILGKPNIQKWVPSYGEKISEPESVHIHPDYKEFSSDADIAIIVLSERVEFTEYIRPVCLWSSDTEVEKIVGKQGTVVGWGKDENGNLMTAEPKQIQLPVVSQETCLRSSYQFQHITSNRTFCAGLRDGSGPCNGDSGSGFTMKQEGRWMLRGLVSISISESHARTCDLTNFVVFTDASKFHHWIWSIIK